MILLNLDRKSEIPLFKQTLDQLKEKIDNEILKPGDVLPSTRTFSNQLGVNRATIYGKILSGLILGFLTAAFTERKQALHNVLSICFSVENILFNIPPG